MDLGGNGMISKEEFLKKCETNIIKKLSSDEEYKSLFRKSIMLLLCLMLVCPCMLLAPFIVALVFGMEHVPVIFISLAVLTMVLFKLAAKILNKLVEINKSVMKNAFSYLGFHSTETEVLYSEILETSPVLKFLEVSFVLKNNGIILGSFKKESKENRRYATLISIPYKAPCEAVITNEFRPSRDFKKVKPSFEHPFFKDNDVFMKDLSKQSVLLTPNLIEKITKIQSLFMPESLKSDETFGMDVIFLSNQIAFVFETSENEFELSMKSMLLKNLFNFKVIQGKETVMYNINTFETLYNKLSNINQTIDLLGD